VSRTSSGFCLGEINGLRGNAPRRDRYRLISNARLDISPRPQTTWLENVHNERFTGCLIQSVNPATSKTHLSIPFYLLQSVVCKSLPKPYHVKSQDCAKTCSDQGIPLSPMFWRVINRSGILSSLLLHPILQETLALFVRATRIWGDIGSMTTSDCPHCSPTVTLDLSQGRRVLEHIGSHILYDPAVIRSIEPLCGMCLSPSQPCQFYLAKGKGANGNLGVNQKCQRAVSSRWTTLMARQQSPPLFRLALVYRFTVPFAQRLTLPSGNISWRFTLKESTKT